MTTEQQLYTRSVEEAQAFFKRIRTIHQEMPDVPTDIIASLLVAQVSSAYVSGVVRTKGADAAKQVFSAMITAILAQVREETGTNFSVTTIVREEPNDERNRAGSDPR